MAPPRDPPPGVTRRVRVGAHRVPILALEVLPAFAVHDHIRGQEASPRIVPCQHQRMVTISARRCSFSLSYLVRDCMFKSHRRSVPCWHASPFQICGTLAFRPCCPLATGTGEPWARTCRTEKEDEKGEYDTVLTSARPVCHVPRTTSGQPRTLFWYVLRLCIDD